MVPSQSGNAKYQVNLKAEMTTCICLDHETRGVKCKHIYAATFVMRRDQNADGSTTVTESFDRHGDEGAHYVSAKLVCLR